jgi:hypothetical protein
MALWPLGRPTGSSRSPRLVFLTTESGIAYIFGKRKRKLLSSECGGRALSRPRPSQWSILPRPKRRAAACGRACAAADHARPARGPENCGAPKGRPRNPGSGSPSAPVRPPISGQAEPAEADEQHRPGRCFRNHVDRGGRIGDAIVEDRQDVGRMRRCVHNIKDEWGAGEIEAGVVVGKRSVARRRSLKGLRRQAEDRAQRAEVGRASSDVEQSDALGPGAPCGLPRGVAQQGVVLPCR